MLLYEAFHGTLRHEFPDAQFYVYVDDVAIVTRDKTELQRILARAQQLSDHLGLKVNRSKTEVYLWDHSIPKDHIKWEGDTIPVQPPIFKYLGHIMAHPEWVKKAQENILDEQLAGYERLPLNAWERVELVNSVLTSQWTYRLLLIPSDIVFKELDKLTKDFVVKCKGLERGRHSTKMSTPVQEGGMGLYQQFWAFRKRYVTIIQRLLRDPNRSSTHGDSMQRRDPSTRYTTTGASRGNWEPQWGCLAFSRLAQPPVPHP